MKIKNLIVIGVVALLIILCFNNIFAFNDFTVENVNKVEGSVEGMDTANNAVRGIWGTVLLVLQICAVAAFVLAGVRYMFAAPDAKADIKKQTVGLVVGAILVFGATFVIDFLVNIVKDIANSDATNNKAVVYQGTIEPANDRYSDYDEDKINDWDDDLKVENGVLVSGEDNIPDIYQQDSNNNGICDYEDLWLPSH